MEKTRTRNILRSLGFVIGFLGILAWAGGALACGEGLSEHGPAGGMTLYSSLAPETLDSPSPELCAGNGSFACQSKARSCMGLCCFTWQALDSDTSWDFSPLIAEGSVFVWGFLRIPLLTSGIEHPPRAFTS